MNGTVGTLLLGLAFGIGFTAGAVLTRGGIKYIDTATGGSIIPDEFVPEYYDDGSMAQSDVTYFFPDFNQRATLA